MYKIYAKITVYLVGNLCLVKCFIDFMLEMHYNEVCRIREFVQYDNRH